LQACSVQINVNLGETHIAVADGSPSHHVGDMCGRVIQSSAPIRYAIVDGMNVRDSRVHNDPPRWNGAPSQDLLVIRRNHKTGEVSLDPLRWGLILARGPEGWPQADQRQMRDRIAERVSVEATAVEIVQVVEVLRDELIVRDPIMGELGARGSIATELVMGKLAPCVHPVRGIEPVVRSESIVRSRDVVSARKVVSASEIATHEAAGGMACKAMAAKTIAMAGQCAATQSMRREPMHATARKPPPGWKPPPI
jgi:hypothetical protein